jgi:hypothetical protein
VLCRFSFWPNPNQPISAKTRVFFGKPDCQLVADAATAVRYSCDCRIGGIEQIGGLLQATNFIDISVPTGSSVHVPAMRFAL